MGNSKRHKKDKQANKENSKNIIKDDTVAENFKSLVMDDTTSDITLIVEETRIPAHKAILSARSEYFSALLLNGMQESNEKEINLKGHGDLKMSVFKPILDYIYTGEMDMASKDDHLIIAIWVEASFFGLVKLSDKIVKYTYAQAATKNNLLSWAFEMLSIAHVHQNTKLKEKCFVELDKDAEASIKRSNEINKLSGDLLKELIARDTFCVEETLIYEAVNGWISANQPEESVSNLEKQRFGWTKQDLFDEVRIQHIPPEILFNNDKMLASFRDRQIILAMKSNHCTRIQDKRFRGYKAHISGIPTSFKNNVVTVKESIPLNGPAVRFFGLSSLSNSVEQYISLWYVFEKIWIANGMVVKFDRALKKKISRHSFCVMVSSTSDPSEQGDWKTVTDFSLFTLKSAKVRIFFEQTRVRSVKVVVAALVSKAGNGNQENGGAGEFINVKPEELQLALFHHRPKQARLSLLSSNLLLAPEYDAASASLPAKNICYLLKPRTLVPNNHDIFSDSTEHSLTSGFLYHPIGNDFLISPEHPDFVLPDPLDWHLTRPGVNVRVICLQEPHILDSFRFLLPTGNLPEADQPSFQYRVAVSKDFRHWKKVCDNSNEICKGWQVIRFNPSPIVYIMFEGTNSSWGFEGRQCFGLVHFEFPAPTEERLPQNS